MNPGRDKLDQIKTSASLLAYESPKLHKHGTIHDMTLGRVGPGATDSGLYADFLS
jgi:hypothetical protein